MMIALVSSDLVLAVELGAIPQNAHATCSKWRYSTVSVKVDVAIPTSRSTNRTLPASAGVSTMVRNVNPGPPESESCKAQWFEAKCATVPAHRAKFVPAMLFPNEIFSTVAVVVVTGAPVTKNFPVAPTVPVMVVAAKALPVEAAKSASTPTIDHSRL
jgi:hypothetical protein